MGTHIQTQIVEHLRRIQTEGNINENFVIFTADRVKNYYVQFATESVEDSQGLPYVSFYAEVVSNHYLEPEHQLTASQVQQLEALGWQRPDLTDNFHQAFQANSDLERAEIARLVIRTLEDVYGFTRFGQIEVEIHIG